MQSLLTLIIYYCLCVIDFILGWVAPSPFLYELKLSVVDSGDNSRGKFEKVRKKKVGKVGKRVSMPSGDGPVTDRWQTYFLTLFHTCPTLFHTFYTLFTHFPHNRPKNEDFPQTTQTLRATIRWLVLLAQETSPIMTMTHVTTQIILPFTLVEGQSTPWCVII